MKGLCSTVRQLIEAVQSEEQRETEKNLIFDELQKIVFEVGEPRMGSSGKVVMTAEGSGDLSDCHVTRGDMVTLRSQYDTSLRGIVLEIETRRMVFTFGDATPALRAPNARWVLASVANRLLYKRMRFVLWDMKRLASGRVHGKPLQMWVGNEALVRTLLTPRPTGKHRKCGVVFFDKDLNVSQREAVTHALGAPDVALIHGPPGTGKTRVLVELIRQAVAWGERVLVCASSNSAVDRVMKEVGDNGVDCLRVGNPDSPKVVQDTKHCYLEHRIEGSEEGIEIERAEKEMRKLLAGALEPSFDDWDHFSEVTDEIRGRLVGLKERSAAKVMPHATAVFCTLSTTGGSLIAHQCFDVLIVDEATKALEPECWLAISHCKKVILAGDVHQMPPSVYDERSPLALSLFERLLPHFAAPRLNIQYRMHQDIMRFPASQHYTSLEAHISVKHHLLSQLPGVTATGVTTCPLLYVNTADHQLEEEHRGQTITDEGEADLVMTHVDRLTAANVPPEAIGIICTYEEQVQLPRKRAANKYPQLTIISMNGAILQEKEAVILSLGRPSLKPGYLRDYRRLNAAITRARRHLCVIGDTSTLTTHPPVASSFLSAFLRHLTGHAKLCCPGDT